MEGAYLESKRLIGIFRIRLAADLEVILTVIYFLVARLQLGLVTL